MTHRPCNSIPNAFTVFRRIVCLCAATGLMTLAASGAFAQSPKIFVSLNGNDSNSGTSASPMRTFQAAYNAVNAGGQIVVLDTAGFGPLNISKSLSITVPPGVSAFVTVSGSYNGITVTAGPNDLVSLRGLIIEGPGRGVGNISGVLFNGTGTLRMDDCVVRNFATGINVSTIYSATLTVRGCTIQDPYNGIYVSPNAVTMSATASVTNTTIEGASNAGIVINTPDSSITNLATVDACVLTHCATALSAVGPGITDIFAWGNVFNYDANVISIQGAGLVNSYGSNRITASGFTTPFTGTSPTY